MAACPGGGLWADWSPLLGPTAAANFALVSRPCPELPQRVPGSAKGTRQGRAAGSLGEGGVRKEGGGGKEGAQGRVGRGQAHVQPGYGSPAIRSPGEGLNQVELALPGLRTLGAPGRGRLGERALSELSWQAWRRASFARPGSEHVMSTKTEPPGWQVSSGAVEGSPRQSDPCLPYGGMEVSPWPDPFQGSF